MTIMTIIVTYIFKKAVAHLLMYMYSKKYTLKRAAWWKALFFVDIHPFSYYLTKISFNQKMSPLSYSPSFQNDL